VDFENIFSCYENFFSHRENFFLNFENLLGWENEKGKYGDKKEREER
jgi:hypothetical protein